jgi:hypothetical protein
MSAANLQDPDAIITDFKDRCNAGQFVFGVCSDDDRRKLLELGTLKLDGALKTLRLTEATQKQSANLKSSDASSISRMSQSTYKKKKNSNQQKKVSFDTRYENRHTFVCYQAWWRIESWRMSQLWQQRIPQEGGLYTSWKRMPRLQ